MNTQTLVTLALTAALAFVGTFKQVQTSPQSEVTESAFQYQPSPEPVQDSGISELSNAVESLRKEFVSQRSSFNQNTSKCECNCPTVDEIAEAVVKRLNLTEDKIADAVLKKIEGKIKYQVSSSTGTVNRTALSVNDFDLRENESIVAIEGQPLAVPITRSSMYQPPVVRNQAPIFQQRFSTPVFPMLRGSTCGPGGCTTGSCATGNCR